ncbi:glycogen debranching N-terminal domain-containing protein [Actinokineospora fastidiosa]|uniref:glycogen debranching N-terminal domain-containing protein n=1 Tax=Actinokineospora fastidiosa TaxID=1816 RepID=UPI001670D734|nr:glycogen debranching N-terminal domain-containing protein [Actinokineospora fastidiosa]
MRHPLVHDLVVTTAAPSVLLCGQDGQLRGTGAHGLLHGDRRVLSGAVLTVDGREPEVISGRDGFLGLLRDLDPGADPTARVWRRRTLRPGVLTERLELELPAGEHTVEVVLWADLAGIEHVRSGVEDPAVPALADGWAARGLRARVRAPGADLLPRGDELVLRWTPTGPASLEWTLEVDDPDAVFAAAASVVPRPEVVCDDPRLAAVVSRAVDDLDSLLLADGPDTFAAAGAPWYLTLFGRDSLWTARLGLPWTTALAGSTLRVLARVQGVRHDPATGEAPGKIPHERRRAGFRLGGMVLPPLYYGTIDATALWVCLLSDAHRHGLPDDEVRALLPALRRALAWIAESGGRYVDETGQGLANQGWKDSVDAVRFADGSFAVPPIALAEVQGYNHEALVAGAALLERFGEDPGGHRAEADRVAADFRARFWVDGVPAMAVDGTGAPVDSPASNMAHLLGTGILTPAESAAVAARIAEPDLTTPYGLRTMSDRVAAYNPLSYHCGSIWPHDTAIAIRALAEDGFGDQAADLAARLVRAGAAIGELPELYAGYADGPAPIPYPAACRPQAWSSAAALTVLTALLGLRVDGREITVRPPRPMPLGALAVSGIPLPGGELAVAVDRDGTVLSATAPEAYRIRRADP